MTVGEADPEARAVHELLENLAPEALSEASRWEDRVDLSTGELILQLASWTSRVDVVGRALIAVDQRWRLARAIVVEEPDYVPSAVRDLIDGTPGGLIVIDVAHGSLRVRLRELRPAGKTALAVVMVFVSLTGYQARDAISMVIRDGDHTENCRLEFTGELSDETRDVLAELPALPDGCSLTVHLRAIARESREAAVAATIPPTHSEPATPWPPWARLEEESPGVRPPRRTEADREKEIEQEADEVERLDRPLYIMLDGRRFCATEPVWAERVRGVIAHAIRAGRARARIVVSSEGSVVIVAASQTDVFGLELVRAGARRETRRASPG